MADTPVFLMMMSVAVTLGQRPPFAGSKPIGYPELISSDPLGNRFGEGDASITTQRLPIEALGNKDLVDRLSQLPVDKQPFWLLNWQALEANRNNPQSYPQRPSQFAQALAPNANNGPVNTNLASSNPGGLTSNSGIPSSIPASASLFTNSARPSSNAAGAVSKPESLTSNSASLSSNPGEGNGFSESNLGNGNGANSGNTNLNSTSASAVKPNIGNADSLKHSKFDYEIEDDWSDEDDEIGSYQSEKYDNHKNVDHFKHHHHS